MAKDYVTGKKTTFGNKRSHSLNSTRRAWKPNLQKFAFLLTVSQSAYGFQPRL